MRHLSDIKLILFDRFEEIGSSNGHYEDDESQPQSPESNGIIRLTRKKKAPKEHVYKKEKYYFLCLFISRSLIMKCRK
jgi:hypothetical protein